MDINTPLEVLEAALAEAEKKRKIIKLLAEYQREIAQSQAIDVCSNAKPSSSASSTIHPSEDSYSKNQDKKAASDQSSSEVQEVDMVTPPIKKKLVQTNLMYSYRISASNTNKAGVTTTISPAIVQDSPKGHVCSTCFQVFLCKFSLLRHTQFNCQAVIDKATLYRPGKANNRGSNVRRSYTNKQKQHAVLFYDSWVGQCKSGMIAAYCKETGIAEHTVRNWLSTEEKRREITRQWMRAGLRARGTVAVGKFFLAEDALFAVVLEQRRIGRRVSPLFISRTMVVFVRTMYVNASDDMKEAAEAFSGTPSWRCRFYNRYKLTIRRRTNKKSLSLEQKMAKWQQYHAALRLFFSSDLTYGKYGKFHPRDRYNVDQVSV